MFVHAQDCSKENTNSGRTTNQNTTDHTIFMRNYVVNSSTKNKDSVVLISDACDCEIDLIFLKLGSSFFYYLNGVVFREDMSMAYYCV